MEIITVDLAVTDPQRAARWYADTLGLPVSGTDVTVGSTTLHLYQDDRVSGTAHLAFDVPTARFDAARAWLTSLMPLLTNADGQDDFPGPASWRSRSIYFTGGVGEILELIAREEIDAPDSTGAFSPSEILWVSEVGVALPDPVVTRDELRSVGIDDYHETGPEFAPVGDVRGLLIAVAPGRAWAPSGHTHVDVSPLRVVARTGHEGVVRLNDHAELVAMR